MSKYAFRTATRTQIKPLIGVFGKSGGGKTFSALLVARGIVGPAGRIALIDTENGRGSLFCDQIPGGYDTIDLQPPFTPDNYAEAIDAAEEGKYDALVIDSATHEWNGQGGYLDLKEAALDRMAGNDWKKREACKFAAAAQCKPAHNKLIAKIVRCSMPVILCFRAKDKVRMEKTEQGKTKVEADEHSSPIQDGDFIFEMLIAGEVMARTEGGPGGFMRVTKYTHPALVDILPQPNEQLTIKHGEAIAKWARGEGTTAPVQQPTREPKSEVAKLKARLWLRVKGHFKETVADFEAWLETAGHIQRGESLASLDAERLEKLCVICEEKFDAPGFV